MNSAATRPGPRAIAGRPGVVADPAEVGAGAEGPLPRPGEHHDPDAVVGLGQREGLPQLAHHLVRERVVAVDPVDGDPGHRPVDVVADQLHG